MKLLRSLLRIATTVCICMAIIACVTIVVPPQVLRNWPGDYAADPVVQLTNNFTPVRLAHPNSGVLPVVQSAPAVANFVRPGDDGESGWVLAESQPAPAESPASGITSRESPTVASESPDAFIPARPTGEEYDPKNDDAAADPDVRLVPESYTIRAEPQGRVRIEGENGSSLEASEITLENAPAHGDSDRLSTVSENAGEHMLPEFLRGRDLPPLGPGEKAVTVHVPVDDWVDLSAGELVDVRSDHTGAGVNSDAGVKGTIHIDELERVEVYALPGIAPENSETVPVCLKVNPAQARLLIKLRASKTPVRLMVVKSAHAAADPYRASSATPSATRLPLRSEDDFAEPTPVRTPPAKGDAFRLPEAAPTPVGDPIVPVRVAPVETPEGDFAPTRVNGPKPQPQSELPADDPADNRVPPRSWDDLADPTPARKPQAKGDDFRLPEAAPTPVGDPIVPVTVVPVRPQTGEDFAPPTAASSALVPQSGRPIYDPTPVATAEPQPAPSRRDEHVQQLVQKEIEERLQVEQEQSLPAIEPSDAGTVIPVQEGTMVGLQAGQAVVVEDKNEGAIKRVSGFDATLIRVTALSGFRLKIEGLKAGETVLTIAIPNVYRQPLRIPVTVEQPTALYLHTTENTGLRVNHLLLDSPGAEVRKATDSVVALKDGGEYSLVEGSTLQLESSQPIASVDGHDQSTIGVTHLGPQRLRIGALQGGESTLQVKLKGSDDDRPITATIRVKNKSHAELERLLRKLYPAANVTVESVRESVLLRGSVATESELLEIGEIAGQYAAKVLNQLRFNPTESRDSNAAAEDSAVRRHTVTLELRPDQAAGIAQGDKVDVFQAFEVRRGNAVELAEREISRDIEVIRLDANDNRVLVTLRGTNEMSAAMRDRHNSTLRIAPHVAPPSATYEAAPTATFQASPSDPYEAPSATMRPPAATYESPAEESAGSAESITLSKECDVAITPAGKLDIASCAKCHIDQPQLNLKSEGAEDPLRDDIRSLHDDVRKLITLLERRAVVTPPEHGGPLPQPQDAQTPLNPVEPAKAAGPVEPQAEPEAPPSPPESMTDAKRPKSVDRETAAFLERTWWLVGMRFAPIDPESPQLRTFVVNGGLVVQEIWPDSPVAKAGLEVGDVVIGVHNWETTDAEDFRYAINQMADQKIWDVTFHFIRADRRLTQQVVLNWVNLESPPHGATESANLPPDGTAARTSGLNPTAAARKKLLDEIGRVILRRDYPRALELAESYKAADPDTEFAAIQKIGPENVPVLAVATAQWSAPCQKLQPLLTKLQNDGHGLVILDSDDAADAELIQQLRIGAFPTLTCVVDGSKKGELVGVFNQTQFDRFFNQFGDMIQEMLDKLESDADESKPGIEVDIPAATSQSVRDSHGDVRAIDINRTFQFYVGFAR